MAGSGRRTFVPGEVLTASNVMSYLQDQAVMNFAGTAARGSAIGTAVAEGMVSYLADSDMIEAYDGTSWRRHSAGLVPIYPTAVTSSGGSVTRNAVGVVSFTGSSQVELENVFTSEFKNYQVKVNFSDFSNATDVAWRGKSAGTIYTGLQYYLGGFTIRASTTQLSYSSNPDNRAYFGGVTTSSTWHTSTLEIFSPQLANNATSFTFSTVGYNGSVANVIGGGIIGVNTQFDSFVLLPAGGTFSGTVQVFGFND